MKNVIYVVVIVICLLVAGFVIFGRGSGDGGISSISDEETIWVLCMQCNDSHEMSKKEYFQQIDEKGKELSNPMAVRYLTCEKCGEDAVIEAIKCEKCGNVFRKGSVPNDFPDRCPKCKFSKTEAVRKERLGQ